MAEHRPKMSAVQVAELRLRRTAAQFTEPRLTQPDFQVGVYCDLKRAAIKYTAEALRAQTEAWFAEHPNREDIYTVLNDLLSWGDL